MKCMIIFLGTVFSSCTNKSTKNESIKIESEFNENEVKWFNIFEIRD